MSSTTLEHCIRYSAPQYGKQSRMFDFYHLIRIAMPCSHGMAIRIFMKSTIRKYEKTPQSALPTAPLIGEPIYAASISTNST